MLVAALDPELYLKSQRTQRRMGRVLAANVVAALPGAEVKRLAGHRLLITTDHAAAVERLSTVFGIAAVEIVERLDATDMDALADEVAERMGPVVAGKTFAVRPRRIGTHTWNSQDLAVATGARLVRAGGRVDLTNPEVTVVVRVVERTADLTVERVPAAGGMPLGTQGNALVMFSGGIDSPVASYMVARRGVSLDYIHFSLGCGQADHAAAIAHDLSTRYGHGSDPLWIVCDIEAAVPELTRRVDARLRQMALKALMYRAAEQIAADLAETRALVNGESLGQVSTQTLDNLASLDRLVDIPVLRPLLGLDKLEIRRRSEAIGTYEASSRSRELCDISQGSRVSVATRPGRLMDVGEAIEDLVAHTVTTAKQQHLRDWMPGSMV
ncbi:MAG TPA: THUMP domain-containing protein [Acidimicrobiia bacterium]|nr:THUMP domain-containing protein [Acidimicrobiia bacterium]